MLIARVRAEPVVPVRAELVVPVRAAQKRPPHK